MYQLSKRSISFIARVFCVSEQEIIDVLSDHNVFLDSDYKECGRCENIKHLDNFADSQKTKRSGWCRKWVTFYDQGRRKDPIIYANKREYDKDYRENNYEYYVEYMKNYYQENKDTLLPKFRKYHKENYDTIIKPGKDRYRQENPEKIAEWALNYRMQSTQSTPKWADLEKIKQIYKKRDRLTKETGISHHVDHIIPLQSEFVCGLHVENNLQILTEKQNKQKSNKI